MIKKLVTTGLMVASLYSISWAEEGPQQATRDLKKVEEIFNKNTHAQAFGILNGTGGSSMPLDGGAKGGDVNRPNELSAISPKIFCVEDSKWAANPVTPTKVGQSANDLVDSEGRNVVDMLITALRGKTEATVTVKMRLEGTLDGALQDTTFAALDKSRLKGSKGDKFFCFTSYKATT